MLTLGDRDVIVDGTKRRLEVFLQFELKGHGHFCQLAPGTPLVRINEVFNKVTQHYDFLYTTPGKEVRPSGTTKESGKTDNSLIQQNMTASQPGIVDKGQPSPVGTGKKRVIVRRRS